MLKVDKLIKVIRWFYPGLRIKRWIILLLTGVALIFVSSQYIKEVDILWKVFSRVLFTLGTLIVIVGIIYLLKSFFEVIYPHKDKGLIDIIYEKRFLSRGPKIVAVGGGHGLSTILEGLKE